MPDLAIEYLPLAGLTPYARNARTHSPAQVAQLVASIREFGWTNPVLVDEAGGIIAGHGRVMAAQQLGIDPVPCIRLAHLTDAQRRAYVLADNRLALNAGWDEELLAQELAALDAMDYNLDLLGFDSAEVDRLLASVMDAPDADADADREDATPDLRPQAITRAGDLWILGSHRVLCGDSTEASDVVRLVDGRRAGLMATDPPYGVSHVATKDGIPVSGFSNMAERWEHIANDDLQDKVLQDFLERAFRAAVEHALTENAAWYLWHAHLTQGFFAAAAAAAAADVLLHRQIIWVKPSLVLTRSGMYHWRHEPCFYGWRRGHMPPWHGNKSQTSVWAVGRDRDTVHPTQKPVALWEAPIANHTRRGEYIYEPFAGSGSQLIAAEKASRGCLAMELSPHYVDAIVRRWQDYTGGVAVLDGDGRSFAQVEAERAMVPA
jgi:DNA modification methylase